MICAVGDLSSEHCSLNHNGQYNIDTGSDIIGRFIQRPYDEIDTIFSKLMEEDGINPGDFRSLSPSILTKVDVGSFYRKQLSTTNLVERHVPALSKSSIPDTVVRYRGMVQNIYDQEFYCGAYEEINLLHQTSQIKLGKYRDNISIQGYSTDNEIHVNIDGPSGLTLERHVLYCTDY